MKKKKRLLVAAVATVGVLSVAGNVAWADSDSGSNLTSSPAVALVSINGHAPVPNVKVQTVIIKGDTAYRSDGSTFKLNHNARDTNNSLNRVSKTVSLDDISATVTVAPGTDVEIHKIKLSNNDVAKPSNLNQGEPFVGVLASGARNYYGPYHLNSKGTLFESVAWHSDSLSTFEVGLLDTSNNVLYYVTTTKDAGGIMGIQWTASQAGIMFSNLETKVQELLPLQGSGGHKPEGQTYVS